MKAWRDGYSVGREIAALHHQGKAIPPALDNPYPKGTQDWVEFERGVNAALVDWVNGDVS